MAILHHHADESGSQAAQEPEAWPLGINSKLYAGGSSDDQLPEAQNAKMGARPLPRTAANPQA